MDKQKSEIQELITTLYLRLNGYLTSGFIFQSNENKIKGEVDLLAIRFPLHRQDETEHNSSIYLEVPNDIDIIIGEVKSKGQRLQFNDSLKDKQNLSKILGWIGLFDDKTISLLVVELQTLITPIQNSKRQSLMTTKAIPTNFGSVKVRPIIFSPERIELNNADKFINWPEMNNFIWSCLCPYEKRDKCGTRYDFNAWGQGLSKIVKLYKETQKQNKKLNKIDDLYSQLIR